MCAATFSAVLDLMLPRQCVGCARPGAVLCRACVAACGPGGPVACGPLPVVAAVAYGGAVRRAVLAYKERGRRDVATALGGLLGAAVTQLRAADPSGAVVLVPVPSNRAAAVARGGDHVVRLARRAAVASGVRVAPGVLRLGRAVRDSAGLGIAEREQNLHGALSARPPDAGLRRCRVVVVDDVVTTGATLREAHRALGAAGWAVAGAAVVAATPRRVPASHWQCPAERSSVRMT